MIWEKIFQEFNNAAPNILFKKKNQKQIYLHGYQDLQYMVRESSIQINELVQKFEILPSREEKPYILSNHYEKT